LQCTYGALKWGMTNHSKPDTPGVHVPPPVIVVVFLAIGLAADKYFPSSFGAPMNYLGKLGGVLIVGGFALAFWCAWKYHKAKTSILPHTKDSAIIDTGPFRFSRNPIYLSMILVFIGVCFYWNAPIALLFLIPTILTLRYYVIAKEEAYLIRRFGDEYLSYQRKVRRWL